jgi:S-methylmethionine-dependent homocysteine/selenocysteine methylase
MIRIALLLSLMLFGLALFVPPGFATENFQCRHSATPAMLAEIKSQLPDGNAMSDVGRLTSTIDALRRKGLPKSRIINQLTGAYCPIVAQDRSLSAAEKAANVRRFSVQVSQLVYSLESGLDVIINVPFTPDVVDAIDARERKQGLSGPAWISMTVENALQLH